MNPPPVPPTNLPLSALASAARRGPRDELALTSIEERVGTSLPNTRAGAPSQPPSPPSPPGSVPGSPGFGSEEDVDVEDEVVPSSPRRFKVIFHNDDYTTQEFVVFVLMRFFHKQETEAKHIMLTVHYKGAAVAGVYTRDVAETKAAEVMDLARESGMPLLLTTEPE